MNDPRTASRAGRKGGEVGTERTRREAAVHRERPRPGMGAMALPDLAGRVRAARVDHVDGGRHDRRRLDTEGRRQAGDRRNRIADRLRPGAVRAVGAVIARPIGSEEERKLAPEAAYLKMPEAGMVEAARPVSAMKRR